MKNVFWCLVGLHAWNYTWACTEHGAKVRVCRDCDTVKWGWKA